MNKGQGIRDSFEALTKQHGPFEVVLVTAPEDIQPQPGVRRISDGSEITFAVSSLRADRVIDDEGLSHIAEITLVLNKQTVTALHSFLTVLLGQVAAPRRQSGTLLPMAEFAPPSAKDKNP